MTSKRKFLLGLKVDTNRFQVTSSPPKQVPLATVALIVKSTDMQ